MKFNKSLILVVSLILTVLLLSASVVAAEDPSSDSIIDNDSSGVNTTDDQNIPLNDSGLNNGGDDDSKLDTTINATGVSVEEDKPVNIGITIIDNESHNVEFVKEQIKVLNNGSEVNFDLVNSTIVLLDKFDVGVTTLNIKYLGAYAYNGAEKDINVTVFTEATIVPINITNPYQSGNFTFKLVDKNGVPLANKTIRITNLYFYSFNDRIDIIPFKDFTSDENGIIVMPNINISKGLDATMLSSKYACLYVGNYNLTFSSPNSTLFVNNTIEISVTNASATIIAKNYTVVAGSTKYVFQVVNSITGEPIKLTTLSFKIKVNSTDYVVRNLTTNLTGYASVSLNLYPGSYPIIISTIDNIEAKTVNVKTTIIKKNATITASNRNIYYNSAPSAVIKFTDKKTGKPLANAILKVRVFTTSTKYFDYAVLTSSKGTISFSTPLSVGKHKIIISCIDPNYAASSIVRYVTVKKATAKFSAPSFSTYYKSGKLFAIKLTNSKTKTPMYGSKLTIKVFISSNRYYKYTGVTDGNGLVRFNTSTFKPGTYKVVVIDNDAGYTAKTVYSSFKVTKVPTKLTPYAYDGKYNSSGYFKVKVAHSSGKLLAGVPVKIKVYLTSKTYKTYTVKTNSKGYAYLKITLKPKKYSVTVSSGSSYYTANTVKSTITVTN